MLQIILYIHVWLILRKLESEIENLEGKIDDVAKTHKQELRKYYTLHETNLFK